MVRMHVCWLYCYCKDNIRQTTNVFLYMYEKHKEHIIQHFPLLRAWIRVESNVGIIMGNFWMSKIAVQWADSCSRNALQTGNVIANGVDCQIDMTCTQDCVIFVHIFRNIFQGSDQCCYNPFEQ